MKLKFTLLIALISLSFCHSYAQNCKYDFDKKDPMTDERVRRNVYAIKEYFKVSLYRKGNDFRVELNATMSALRTTIVQAGEKIDLRLENGTIVTLTTAQESVPTPFTSGSDIVTHYAVSYLISKEEMQKIATSGIKVVRVKLAGEELIYETNEKIIKKSAEGAQCMLVN